MLKLLKLVVGVAIVATILKSCGVFSDQRLGSSADMLLGDDWAKSVQEEVRAFGDRFKEPHYSEPVDTRYERPRGERRDEIRNHYPDWPRYIVEKDKKREED